ncbi:Uncharacterized protein OBRU01_09485 [Operophtera brumata]|uniref:Major facilitator superfamily (MFS) profile domain-containing protein n=1 Tax=Operophtera brumata TaxID=104452 RepID=A0A0L7LF84_OPEBR|nr:Uncharacterized protein OBRU01_09485 [Operophtera brumata]
MGQILVGYGLGWTAPVIPKLQDPDQTPLPNVISDQGASWIGSLLFIGTITGASICLLSFLVLALANNLAMIFTGRILMGLGTGIIFVVNLVYIGEIASTHIRGILLTATGIFGTFGTLIIYSVGPYVPYSVTGYLGVAITLVYISGIFFIPETPLFLVLRGDEEKAKEILTYLGREEDIGKIVSSKQELSDDRKTNNNQWSEIFSVRSNRKALFITLSLNILQQMSGVIAVIFFATTIFELADSSVEPNIATIIIGITQIAASSVTPFFVERSGRKSLLLFSTAACCLSLGVLGTYFYLDGVNSPLAASVKWLPLLTLIVFFLSYDLGKSIIKRWLTSSTGSTVTITIGWLVGFVVATAFGYMIQLGPYFAFWFYAAACAAAFAFTVIFVPETRGKSLAEIQHMLSQ